MSLQETASKNVKALRERAGLSQEKFSELSDVDVRYISQVENQGSNLTLSMLEKFAKGLGVPAGVLLSDDLKEPSSPKASKAMAQGLRYAIKLLQTALKSIES